MNIKELTAVECIVQSFAHPLLHQLVNLYVDSLMVLRVLQKMTSSPDQLMDALRTLFYLFETYSVTLHLAWLPIFENMTANFLSHHTDTEVWAISQRIFEQLNRSWGPLTIYLFAMTKNRFLPKFNSRWYYSMTQEIDVFAQGDWKCERNWYNPPFS